MPKLGLFTIENGKKVLADDSLADMIMKICRKAKMELGRRGKEVELEEIFSDTISVMYSWPSGILNPTSEEFNKVKAMKNPDGTLPENTYGKVRAMVGQQVKQWSRFVGNQISIYGTKWAKRSKEGAIKTEPIATDKKTQRQKDIERDDRLTRYN